MPERVEPMRLARQGATIAGEMALSAMPRLQAELHEPAGAVHAELRFGVDEDRRPCLWGRITTAAQLICQRCLEPVAVPVDAEVRLGLVLSEDQAAHLPAAYDPLMVQEEPMALAGIIEDELLLSLPAVARHEEGVCGPPAGANQSSAEEEEKAERPSPFAELARLKDKS